MNTNELKILITTTPIRPVPNDYPPFGSMAVIQALRAAGYDPVFYDIDCLRPSFEEVEARVVAEQPDVLGISAVVSTAYAYTKQLVRMVRRVSPRTRIVLGGNLAASAEILHRLAGVDYCVSGEGEIVSVNLMNYIADRVSCGLAGDDYQKLRSIPGISFLDADDELVFTGYETKIPAEELFEPDFSILEQFSRIENFINDPFSRSDFARDPRTHEPHRKGKRMACVVSSKGCVARCTFCHRWDKGYRALDSDKVIHTITYLQQRYNVGFFQIADENFGSDRKQANAFIEAIKSLDVLYHVAGVRCRTVDPDFLRRLRDSGCVAVYYGMETGSERILQVMEKNTTLQDNLNAAVWTAEAGLYTVYQLVLAMPGENEETISETVEFFKKATEILPDSPLERLSVNYIQALPGTPVYEYARHKGLIGKALEDEEKYLELISDTNANDDTKFINFTDWDYLTVQSWRRRLTIDCYANYMRNHGFRGPSLRDVFRHVIMRRLNPAGYARMRRDAAADLDYNQGGYFNLQRSLHYEIIAKYFYSIRLPILWGWLMTREFTRLGPRLFGKGLLDTLRRRMFGPKGAVFAEYRSLRKVVDSMMPPATPRTPSEIAMQPFRAGR